MLATPYRQKSGTFSVSRVYGVLLLVVLAIYAYLGRSGAHIGVPPVYIGEILLVLGVASLGVLLQRHLVRKVSPNHIVLVWLVGLYMIWGFVWTATDLSQHGLLAIRDAVIWYYATFFFISYFLVRYVNDHRVIIGWYWRYMKWILIWMPIVYLVRFHFAESIPNFPGQEFSIIHVRPGEFAVHLAGVITFWLLGLHKIHNDNTEHSKNSTHKAYVYTAIGIVLAIICFVLLTSARGPMLAVLVPLAIVVLFRFNQKRLFISGSLAILVIFVMVSFDIKLGSDIQGERERSVRQAVVNIVSLSEIDENVEVLGGTTRWRKRLWGDLLDSTIANQRQIRGMGFGEWIGNHTYVTVKEDTRSPHNVFVTIVFRMGAVGILIFGSILLVSISVLAKKYRTQGRTGDERITLWLMVYLLAFLINAAFDVYVESPQGGIWFWSLLGFAIAQTSIRTEENRGTLSASRLALGRKS